MYDHFVQYIISHRTLFVLTKKKNLKNIDADIKRITN